ncbi:MAG: SIMPL domain-containing protein [Thaumarchaeota archaeon]|nr:SIMPL domain-containing protein [Candidatus Geocrenenecus arthurdayi]
MRTIVSGVSIAALIVALALMSNVLITSSNQPIIQSSIKEESNLSYTKTTLTVVGYGLVRYNPDSLSVSFTMVGQGTSAEEALTRCSEKTVAVINLLKSLGISEEDMKTSYINVYPVYDWEAKPPRIIGYQAEYSLSIVVRDIQMASKVIDNAVKAGADRINGVTFTLSSGKEDELKMEAIKAAVEDARAKANIIAKTLGLKILSIESISLSSTEVPTPIPLYREQVATATIPILPSQGVITATVTLVYILGAET